MTQKNVVLDHENLAHVVQHFSRQQGFAFDVETVGQHRGTPKLNTVTWLSMATHGMAVTIPFGHPIGSRVIGTVKEPRADKNGKIRYFSVPVYDDPPAQLPIGEAADVLYPLFFNPDITKVAHEATFDCGSMAKYWPGDEEIFPGPYDDTKVIMRLLDENTAQKNNGLKAWTERVFGVTYDHENVGKRVEVHPFNKVAHYSYMDSLYTWLLWLSQFPRIRKQGLTEAHKVDTDLIPVLTKMRLAGAHMDVPQLEDTQQEMGSRLVVQEADCYRAAGQEFNLNSPPQKQKILYGKKAEGGQGLKPWKKTDSGGWSVDADALASYPGNDVCRSLLAYADTHKLLSTYITSWLGEPGNPKKPCLITDGYLYTEFQQHGTVTGRFSGRAPNLQNIPRPDKPYGKLIRGAFDSEPGWKRVTADYGQIELVVLAHMIGRGKLYEGFLKGIDPHLAHAAGVLHKEPVLDDPPGSHPEGVTKDERQRYGKTLGFTIVNGAGWQTVAETGGFKEDEAKQVLEDYEEEFPEVPAYKRKMLKQALSCDGVPYIRTPFLGRKRRLPGLLSSSYGQRGYAERQLFNTLIQGGAAELMKISLIILDRMLSEQVPQAKISMTVHDEVVVATPAEFAELVKRIVIEAMTGPEIQKLVKVALKVDCHIVDRWSEAK